MPQTADTNFRPILDTALAAYARTGNDIASHPLLARLQSCDSPAEILSVLREQAPGFDRARNGEEERLAKWLTPTINVLYAFSAVYPPTRIVLAGIGVLLAVILVPLHRCCDTYALQAAEHPNFSHVTVTDLFGRMQNFFQRLEIYTEVELTEDMTNVIAKFMVEVLSILAIMTKDITKPRWKRFLIKLVAGEKELAIVKNALRKLDKLTEEEALVAAQGMRNNFDVDRGERRRKLLKDVQSWLSLPDPSQNYDIVRRARHAGTAAWFLRGGIYQQWKSTGPLLRIQGKPGSGKSILCSATIEDIEATCKLEPASMGFFFFDSRDTDKQNRLDMLPSLLIQLSTGSKPCCDILARLYLAHNNGAQMPSGGVLTEYLKEMLSASGQRPIYIIMDGLDESPNTSGVPSPREEILELVKELIGLRVPNLRLCVTSRPEIDIRTALEPLSSFRVSLHDEPGQKQDLVDYITFIVNSDPMMRRWREQDKKLVIDTLSRRADGMFQWADYQLGVVRHCLPPNLPDEFPELLSETYERILMEINKAHRERAHRLLQCLVVAVRPLRIEELAEILALDFGTEGIPKLNVDWRSEDSEQAVLSVCSSLIAIVDLDGSRVAQFSHFSVKQFLTSHGLAASNGRVSRYHVSLKSAHTILAQACLGILLRLDDRVDKTTIKDFPLAEYAARHWANHAQFEDVSSRVQDGMKLLFDPEKPHFRTWVWVHDMDSDQSPGCPTMHPTPPQAVPLYYATLCGFCDLAEHLIVTHPQSVNARGGRYVSPIHAASYKGHLPIARLLIEHGADANTRDDEDSTPLHIAAQSGDSELVQLLLFFDADVNAMTSSRSTPLFMALNNGSFRVVQQLVDDSADVNIQDDKLSSPLHVASGNGDFAAVRVLLEHGAYVHARDDQRSTPVHLASVKGNLDVVELLIQHGADVNAQDNKCSTPLRLALINGNLDVVESLIQCGVDVMTPDNKGSTPLHLASAKGNVKVVEMLIQRGADVKARDNKNSTPLHLALVNENLGVVELLIQHDADVHARDNKDSTPLHLALINGNFHIVDLLVQRDADVNARDHYRSTPLHLASDNGSLELVRLLIERSADVKARDNKNSTPLHVASRRGPADVVELLLQNGAELNARNDRGWTPLHIASQEGAVDVVGCLLARGADVNVEDGDRRTPLHLASNNKRIKTAQLLVEYRANVYARDKNGQIPFDDDVVVPSASRGGGGAAARQR